MVENHDDENPIKNDNGASNLRSGRKRSRPVVKKSVTYKLKRNKIALFIIFLIILITVVISVYVIINNKNINSNSNDKSGYLNDPAFISAVKASKYPIAVLNTSKGIIAIELYNDKMPITCQNFIKLVNDKFYNGMIFHRVLDNFMIQAGKYFPDGSSKDSPYGNIKYENSDIKHVDGTISMASTGAGVGGSAEFFICDGAQSGLDGSYAAFGKTIYGIKVVRDIAAEPQDGSSGSAGGGKPYTNIIINSIIIMNE